MLPSHCYTVRLNTQVKDTLLVHAKYLLRNLYAKVSRYIYHFSMPITTSSHTVVLCGSLAMFRHFIFGFCKINEINMWK